MGGFCCSIVNYSFLSVGNLWVVVGFAIIEFYDKFVNIEIEISAMPSGTESLAMA